MNLVSQKGKNKSNFWMVNLCNGGTKDFVELWEIIHLKSINLNYYSQTCSKDHLCKTTNDESTPVENDQQPLFFYSQMKINPSKTTTTKLYPMKECEKNRKQCLKTNVSLLIFTLLLIYNTKFV